MAGLLIGFRDTYSVFSLVFVHTSWLLTCLFGCSRGKRRHQERRPDLRKEEIKKFGMWSSNDIYSRQEASRQKRPSATVTRGACLRVGVDKALTKLFVGRVSMCPGGLSAFGWACRLAVSHLAGSIDVAANQQGPPNLRHQSGIDSPDETRRRK